MRRWERRLARLEARYGVPEDPNDLAINEAIRRAEIADLVILYEAFERLGLPSFVELDALRSLLTTEDEAAALERLCELGEQVLEEWQSGAP